MKGILFGSGFVLVILWMVVVCAGVMTKHQVDGGDFLIGALTTTAILFAAAMIAMKVYLP